MDRIIHPKEQADAIRKLVFHKNPGNHLKYSRKNITEAEQLQDMHRVRSSTTQIGHNYFKMSSTGGCIRVEPRCCTIGLLHFLDGRQLFSL